MKKEYSTVVICPAMRSTRLALYCDEKKILSKTIVHDETDLEKCPKISDQVDMRYEAILKTIKELNLDMGNVDIIASTSGGLKALESGIYRINQKMVEDAGNNLNHHLALGPILADRLSSEFGISELYTVDPPDIDELDEEERITGLKGIYHEHKGHRLNNVESARRYAARLDTEYEKLNLIIIHLGDGVSVAAYRRGKAVCANNALGGDGPISVRRAGSIPAVPLIELCYSGRYSKEELIGMVTNEGGFRQYLNVSTTEDVSRLLEEGDQMAELLANTFLRQIGKQAGACAAVLRGEVDGIIITGENARIPRLVSEISDYLSWIAPVSVQAGNLESESVIRGVMRALKKEADIREYTGIPVWDPASIEN